MPSITTSFEAVPGVAGLSASAPEQLPFARRLDIRAFRLERAAGDILVYSTTTLGAVDGVARWYLNHGHEAMFLPEGLGLPLFTHEADRGDLHVRGTFSRRFLLDDDLEVVPTPGHTPGATAYLWDTGEHRALFTGDTLIIGRNGWHAAVLASSDRERYIESLELLRGLDFDLLVPWIAAEGRPTHAFVDRDEAERRIDEVLERVRAGSDH
jgi:glyoxylase-like metal-dependent hydrolase (beta-lactamase superfamily II)